MWYKRMSKKNSKKSQSFIVYLIFIGNLVPSEILCIPYQIGDFGNVF